MFFSNPWFYRGWTFQELILASNPILLCGERVLHWETLLSGVWGLKKLATIDHQQDYRQELLSLPNSFTDILALCNIWIYAQRSTHRNKKAVYRRLRGESSFAAYQERYNTLIDILWYLKMAVLPYSFIGPWLYLLPGLLEYFGLISGTITWWVQTILSYLAAVLLGFMYVPDLGHLRVDYLKEWKAQWREQQDFPDWIDLPSSLPGIISAIRSRLTTNPKDKSYSIYGILSSLDIPLRPADYSKSPGQIFHELTMDLINWNPSSLVLILDAGLPGMPGVPSWVPNWHDLPERVWLRP